MPKSAAAGRQRMLDAAITLMRGSGLAGAGINEIVRLSGAPKGSVYHHFPGGKVQIASEALADYSGRVARFIEAALGERTGGPAKVRALFAAFAKRAEEGDFRASCAIGTVTLDLDEEPGLDALRPVLEAAFDDWAACIAAHFDFGDRRRSRSFAGLVLTAIEGAYVRSRAERDARAFREAGEWLSRLLPQAP